MYQRRFRKPSKPVIFALLMVGSLVLALMPRDFLAPLRQATQLAGVAQYGATSVTRGVTQSAKTLLAEPVPADEHAKTETARVAAENENIVLRGQVQQLQTMVDELRNVRNRSQFPSGGRLVSARVVGWDTAAGRDSLALFKPTSRNVRKDDWVASSLLVDASNKDIACDERVLARETLIGWVEQPTSMASRVVLLSDRYSHRKWTVHVAKVGRPDRQNEFVMEEGRPVGFALEGIGGGKMRMTDIPAQYVKNGIIRVNDVVTTDGRDPKLPLSMVIGEIESLEPIKKQPLLYNAIVKHRCDPKELADVLIVNIPDGQPPK
ncbi:MAG: hypothetical protein FWC56_02195 [Phycisphaerae bacterium]|nr:hypothetical protein [Phycisphaerae bacterium]